MEITIEYTGVILALILAFLLTSFSIPRVMKKMISSGLYGIDVNKKSKPQIPEMGGIGAILGFSLGASLSLGVVKYFGSIDESFLLVSMSVLGIASIIGLMDDVSILGRKEKAWFITFSSLPLIIAQIGPEKLDFLIFKIDISEGFLFFFFWLILVPIGVSGCANALNMSAGYNGLESGHFLIISITMLIVSIINNVSISIIMIFAALIGSTLALFRFNKYPSKVFVGDIGTLGLGSVLASLIIMSGQIVFGIICILPTFFELFSTLKYSLKSIERRDACMSPVISDQGIISPPNGSEDYSLAYYVLSKYPTNEKALVKIILLLYVVSGSISIFLAFFN